jgi:hypothetical protein
LTFTYFLTVSNQSPQSVSEFTVSAFDAFLTDVSMNTNLSGSISPSNFSRSDEGGGSGQVIRVHFLNPTVGPGDRAASVIVQTSAFAWTATTAGIIDGQTVNVSSLAPLPVPEPGVGALLLLGLGGLAVRKLRRRT